MLTIRWFLVLVLFVGKVVSASDDAPRPPPNLVILNIQELGWGDVSVYSPWRHDTPNIDILAAQGVILDDLYAETSSSASHAALLSGKLPASWGFYSSNNAESTQLQEDSGFSLPADIPLLPQILGNSSYTTKFIGRWHLGQRNISNPSHYGFQEFLGTVSDRDTKYDDLRYPNVGIYRNEKIIARLYEQSSDDLGNFEDGRSNLTNLYGKEAAVFVKKTDAPFYLHLSLDALAHPPYRSSEFVNASLHSRNTPFADALKEIDSLVGSLVAALTEKNQLHNTVLLLAADSTALASKFTGGSNSPFTGETGDTTEGGVRVPAILVYPALTFNTSRSKQALMYQDLHATLLSMLGQHVPACREARCVTDGRDVSASLTSGVSKRRLISIYRGRTLMAVRLGRHKAHCYSLSAYVPGQYLDTLTSYTQRNLTQFPILFDVVADPGERFFVGSGFGDNSARYADVAPVMKSEMEYVLSRVNMTGGLLNECDVGWREWAPPGCARVELCLGAPSSKLAMCHIPEYSTFG